MRLLGLFNKSVNIVNIVNIFVNMIWKI